MSNVILLSNLVNTQGYTQCMYVCTSFRFYMRNYNVVINDGSELLELENDSDPENIGENDVVLIDAFENNINSYISGFITRWLLPHVKCKYCAEALIINVSTNDNNQLIKMRDFGGLIYPNEGMVKILKACKSFYKDLNDKVLVIQNKILNFFGDDLTKLFNDDL